MRILLDTEIVMDVLCNTSKKDESLELIRTAIEKKRVELLILPTAIHDITKHAMKRHNNPQLVYDIFDNLQMIFKFYGMREQEVNEAIRKEILNQEHEYFTTVFQADKFDMIVSRKTRGFEKAAAYVLPPAQAIWKIVFESRLWSNEG